MPAVEEHGMVRLEIRNPLDRVERVIYEARTNQLSRSTTPSEQVPMPRQPQVIGEDYKLALMFKSDAADTVKSSLSTLYLDVTEYEVKQGKVGKAFGTTFTVADLFKADAVCAAGVWTELGVFTVPAGVALQIGQGDLEALNAAVGRFYCKLMDDTP